MDEEYVFLSELELLNIASAIIEWLKESNCDHDLMNDHFTEANTRNSEYCTSASDSLIVQNESCDKNTLDGEENAVNLNETLDSQSDECFGYGENQVNNDANIADPNHALTSSPKDDLMISNNNNFTDQYDSDEFDSNKENYYNDSQVQSKAGERFAKRQPWNRFRPWSQDKIPNKNIEAKAIDQKDINKLITISYANRCTRSP
ncbi:uncharacterized protein LOC100120572 isoform X2 [Nasonia vitripennis]|uniref:Uncharacterized protein n=1 Tax=Nasonia vitripennis TaxID=7425 RepID=A0A7M7IRD0_NASVI|nr:uncharacterized protein LOC100120572 isoform X2 [Nasonia vitripennis]